MAVRLCGGEPATITITNKVSNRITRFMTGACLEDVNHEVYGGIYSQMLYGESFQEPARPPALRQFHVYGGQWLPEGDALAVSAERGAKIVARDVRLGDGRVDVDIRMPRKQDGFAGAIVKVREAAAGADAFIGYEVALNPARQVLRVGRHRHNWEFISDTPCNVTQMVSSHYVPLRLDTAVQCPDHTLDVTAKRSEDGRTMVVSVVNTASRPIETCIQFSDSLPLPATAQITMLTGTLTEINTPDQPRRIAPTQTVQSLSKNDAGTGVVYTFPAHSFTILRVR